MTARNEKDARYHDIIASEYDTVVVRPRDYPNDVLFAPLAKLVGRGEAMLDLGCGTGHMLVRFRDRFGRAIGVDHSVGMIRQAEKNLAAAGRAAAKFELTDVFEFVRAHADRYELVTCVGLLHHLDPATLPQALRDIARLMKPGGHLVIAEPIDVDVATQPAEVVAWNRRSIGARVGYSVAAEEPDEGPIDEKLLRSAIADAGLRVAAENRMWEMSAHTARPNLLERMRIRRLVRRFGANGNVLAMALRAG
jgi:ubiquinone/menaquinone biosynthesis C-methylase UbiE